MNSFTNSIWRRLSWCQLLNYGIKVHHYLDQSLAQNTDFLSKPQSSNDARSFCFEDILHTLWKPDRQSPNCSLCPQGAPGTFYSIWYDDVQKFFGFFFFTASLHVYPIFWNTSCHAPHWFLMSNKESSIKLAFRQQRVQLAGLTAAKNNGCATLAGTAFLLQRKQWLLSFKDDLFMELSVARSHGG